MLDLKTKTAKGEWFIIPEIGLLKYRRVRNVKDLEERMEWRLCFGWLVWRASIRIWQEKK